MGLYDDRMADLSESRRSSRAAGRPGEHPYPKSSGARKRDPMEVQSLLFSRDAGWTTAKAKAWAKEHGYKYGKVDVTEQYIHMRQFSPKGLKVKRTITLGRGIRAVVAREENMAGKKKARRRSPRKKAAPRKRSVRRKTKARATATRRRKRSTVMAAAPKRRRRRKPAAKKRTTRRRSTARATGAANEAWYGNTAGHRKAAKKGVRRRKARRAAPKRRRRRKASEPAVVAAPRRRRRSTTRRASPRRRTYAAAPRRRNVGMGVAEFGAAVVSAGFGYVIADGLDRFLATYNPASTEEKPKDKFTSDGAGTLANTLNVASPPGIIRIGAGVGLAAVPAVASMYVDGKFLKSSLQGLAIGSGVNLFKTLWNNVLMPMLKPKDTSAASLQKSYIARLYPAETAASINRAQKQTAVSSAGAAGALSDAPDVGPFALSRSEYPNAAEALRAAATAAGTGGTPGDDYPTVQNVEGTSRAGDFPTATQAMTDETGRVGAPAAAGNPAQPGVSYEPGPPPLPGPGPQAAPGEDPACACMNDQFLGIGDKPTEEPLYSTTAQ